jgi:hypothetical protein
MKLARHFVLGTAIASIMVEAARAWRTARDARILVQPVLYARLVPRGCGQLAPVLDGLLAMFEAGLRRPFQAGGPSAFLLSEDERDLLDLLADDRGPAMARIVPALKSALRSALSSARLLLCAAIEAEGGAHAPERSILFGKTAAPAIRVDIGPAVQPAIQ